MSAFDKLYERDEVFEEDTLSSGVGSFVEILVLRDAAYFRNPAIRCVFSSARLHVQREELLR